MEECEICGKKSSDLYIVNVEEVELRVCTKCAKGRKIISRISDEKKEARRMVGATPKKNDFDQLIDNYGEVIRNARESMKMPIKVLAELISEKESHLLHIEQQKTRPSEELRKKLEKELGIRLVEPAAGQDEKGGRGGGDGATLGDFVIKKK
jgi:putative transcription factor